MSSYQPTKLTPRFNPITLFGRAAAGSGNLHGRAQPGATSMVDERTDAELLEAYRAGDERAAEALFERYYQRLIGLARAELGWPLRDVEESSDLAQSVLRSVFARGRQQGVSVPDKGDLWPLLVTVMLNKVRNRARYWRRLRRDRTKHAALPDELELLHKGPLPDQIAEMRDTIRVLLESFSPRRRRILELLLQQRPIEEIAADVGTSQRTIYNTRQAATDILRKQISNCDQP